MRAAEANRPILPAILVTFARPLAAARRAQAATSGGPPNKYTRRPAGRAASSSSHLASGYCFVNQTDVGARQI